ncbi:helix-turn-helix transcriptional regulator [Listeria booriae]|uniref:Helix-turn-helix transcriptional regulator n=1 Tax=Listeria booriae TaxID=1552123 RepID=A0A841YNP1_9LIST|nr:helix-turn-helix transcriptional regulator [Listeria booriae]MBC1402105.1 helix-turn-helix transcriptional regulator [Listeria booriae]MBC1617837.1 helix-turn-helix transcriptional regulator [Listeria booriae]
MRTNEEIIDLIVKLRKEQGLSLSRLAEKINMPKSTLSRYENYSREFPLNKADVFASALGVSTQYLLGFDADESSNQLEFDLRKDIIDIFSALDLDDKIEVIDFAKSKKKKKSK